MNHYWRHTRSGKHYISDKGRAFRAEAVKICQQFDPFIGPVQTVLQVYYPDKRSRDPDNLEKALWDGLKAGGLIEDDNNQILLDKRTITVGFKKGRQVILKIREAKSGL